MYAKKRQKTQNEGFLPFFYEQRARRSLNDRLTSRFATASFYAQISVQILYFMKGWMRNEQRKYKNQGTIFTTASIK